MHEKTLKLFGKMVEEAIKHPETAPDKLVIISLSDEEKNHVLTPERLKLVRTIRNKEPKSVKDLARLVGRRLDAVSRDLKILQFYGFLEFIRIGKKKMPKMEKDFILIPVKT